VGRRRDPVELVRSEGSDRFAFLVGEAGLAGPEPTGHGIAYQGSDYRVEIGYFAGYAGDQEVATRLVLDAGAGQRRTSIPLEKAYVACGLGTPQDVPHGAQTLRALSKHLAVQAQVLQRLLAFLAAQDRPVSWLQS
jgi:hypothetical protein